MCSLHPRTDMQSHRQTSDKHHDSCEVTLRCTNTPHLPYQLPDFPNSVFSSGHHLIDHHLKMYTQTDWLHHAHTVSQHQAPPQQGNQNPLHNNNCPPLTRMYQLMFRYYSIFNAAVKFYHKSFITAFFYLFSPLVFPVVTIYSHNVARTLK